MRSSAAWRSLLLLLLLWPAACQRTGAWHREFVALGTVVSIDAWGITADRFDAAGDELEAYLLAQGAEWYPRTDGELRRLNAAIAAGDGLPVSAGLYAMLRRAAEFEARSGGRFNACLGRMSALWGFYDLPDGPAALPDATVLDALVRAAPSCNDLRFDADSTTVTSTNDAVAIDVGGIAKGVLLEDARRLLRRHGIVDAIVNLGGDLLVTGRVAGRAARIGIRAPDGGPPAAGIEARPGEAVFTSGNYERYVEIGGKRYAHVLDPATGRPVEHTASVTVVHPDSTLADAAATALLVGGAAAFDELVLSFGLEYALLVDDKGDARLTPGMAARLHWPETRP